MLYGDNLNSEIMFKGKPLTNLQVEVLTKDSNIAGFKQSFITNNSGRIFLN